MPHSEKQFVNGSINKTTTDFDLILGCSLELLTVGQSTFYPRWKVALCFIFFFRFSNQVFSRLVLDSETSLSHACNHLVFRVPIFHRRQETVCWLNFTTAILTDHCSPPHTLHTKICSLRLFRSISAVLSHSRCACVPSLQLRATRRQESSSASRYCSSVQLIVRFS